MLAVRPPCIGCWWLEKAEFEICLLNSVHCFLLFACIVPTLCRFWMMSLFFKQGNRWCAITWLNKVEPDMMSEDMLLGLCGIWVYVVGEKLLSQLREFALYEQDWSMKEYWEGNRWDKGGRKKKFQNSLGYFCLGMVLKIIEVIHENQGLGWAGGQSTRWPWGKCHL